MSEQLAAEGPPRRLQPTGTLEQVEQIIQEVNEMMTKSDSALQNRLKRHRDKLNDLKERLQPFFGQAVDQKNVTKSSATVKGANAKAFLNIHHHCFWAPSLSCSRVYRLRS